MNQRDGITNFKAVRYFYDFESFYNEQRRLFQVEASQYFDYDGVSQIGYVQKYFNNVKNLNDASKTYEDLAIRFNEYILASEVYKYFKLTGIFK